MPFLKSIEFAQLIALQFHHRSVGVNLCFGFRREQRAVIQDLGYYPFGRRNSATWCIMFAAETSFANCWLESQDVNEYAFALGALSHYASDIAGHPAVNQAVAIEYPKLRAKLASPSIRPGQDGPSKN